jgi:Protein of unknown function (DUF3048) N-terminal domain/Protein of unknown function (DUF3048) C-terminal domain
MTVRSRTSALGPLAVATAAVVVLAGCGGGGGSTGASRGPSPTPTGTAATKTIKAVPTCPLTGTKKRKGQDTKRAALAVKIDNVAPAMPQAGVNSADVVFEELVEGGLTRLMAIFQCNSAAAIGPIRSARTSDADVLALLHGSVFGFSGANPKALPEIDAHGDTVQISQDVEGGDFHRDDSRPAPHNVFASSNELIKAGLAKRKHLHAPKPMFSFGPLGRGAKNAHTFSLKWPDSTASWTFSGGHWLRTQGGSPDRGAGGQQLSAANVVVMSVTIGSTGLHDVLGNSSPLDITVGSHPVWVFRNGKVIKGTWHRRKVTSRITLKRGKNRIALAPGRTWVELLPTYEGAPNIG